MFGCVAIHRHGTNTTRHDDERSIFVSGKLIPFEFKIELPPPLKRGVDYGFRYIKDDIIQIS